MDIMVWLILLIIFIGVEAATLGLTSIWFAGASLVGLIAAALHAPTWLQITLAVVTSFVLLYFTRPIAVKYFNKDRVKTNVDSLIGRQGIVISEIDNLQGIGQVTVSSQQWSARSVEDVTIPMGAVVVVEAISGVKLMVREQKPELKETNEQS